MNKDKQFWNENGQSLVIVALIMVALIAVLAFALDGGNTYFQRRNAQNAADAAALAGANAYCKDNNYNSGLAAATNYANLNGFALADFTVVVTPTAQINVTTTDTFDTFFAGIIGRPQMTVEAVASSSCCVPGGADHIMPIAWACHRPNTFNQSSSTSEDCVAQGISEATLNIYLTDPPPTGYAYPYSHPTTGLPYKFYEELYIVMDSASEPDDLSTVCWQYDSTGAAIDPDPSTAIVEGMDCDFDNDGENDLISNGDRSWVDLDGGGGGANDLKTWVTDGLNSPIHLPVWVDGQPGVTTSVFHDIDALKNNFFLIPVFDAICPGDPSDTSTCSPYNGEPVIYYTPNGFTYRLVTFATFYVTCVDTGNDGCPGNEYLGDYLTTWDPNGTSGFKLNATKTIEGYFVNRDASGNFDSDCSGTGIDFGTYVTRLTR